jgi:hypothetical protein
VQWKKYVLAFLVVAIVGLAVTIYAPAAVGELFGVNAFSLKFLSSSLLPPALVAAVAGYVLPKGFFLWGVAVIFLHPLVEAWQTHRANAGGAFGPSGIGDEQILGLALVLVMMLTGYAFACTVAVALGAGLRLLWWRLRGESL